MTINDTYTYLNGIITVTRRYDDWHACITGRPGLWSCGASIRAAIGDLVMTHPDRLIEYAAAEGARAVPS